MTDTVPRDHGLPGYCWTTSKLAIVIYSWFAVQVSQRELCRQLRRQGCSFKCAKKLMLKADLAKRAEYFQKLDRWYPAFCRGELDLVWIDEVHPHQDVEGGRGWWPTGLPFYVPSNSPGLSAKLHLYGAFDFRGRVLLMDSPRCDTPFSAAFIWHTVWWWRRSLTPDEVRRKKRLIVIWDGAAYHKPAMVQWLKTQAATLAELDVTLELLPAYSPDLNPVEALWRWLRSEVNYGRCHNTLEEFKAEVRSFVWRINDNPERMIDRLWPRMEESESMVAARQRLIGYK